jgi:adenylyl- and sulfurtransferase ThiI
MGIARRIGTYATSSRDVGDCFAVPDQPTVGALLDEVHAAESELPLSELAENALKELKRIPVVG